MARLEAAGVSIRRFRHCEGLPMHDKFMLIDGEASGDLYAVELDIRAETAVEGRSWGEIKRSRANEL